MGRAERVASALVSGALLLCAAAAVPAVLVVAAVQGWPAW